MKIIYYVCCVSILLVGSLRSAAYSATQITGTITAKRADLVNVEFQPHKTAGPAVGDRVDFKTTMKGLEVNAGQGEVVESKSGYAWVKIKKGHPRLKINAIIYATGKPGPVAYGLDIDGMKLPNKQYRVPGARLTLTLPSGLKFKTYSSLSYDTILPDGTGIKVSAEAQGWKKAPLGTHHKQMRDTKFSGGGKANTCEVVWKDRKIEGSSSSCIASRARCIDSLTGTPEKYFELYASCKTASFPARTDLVEEYYSIGFSNHYSYANNTSTGQIEKIFFEALRSLSIEIKD